MITGTMITGLSESLKKVILFTNVCDREPYVVKYKVYSIRESEKYQVNYDDLLDGILNVIAKSCTCNI